MREGSRTSSAPGRRLVQRLFPSHQYVSLDLPSEAEQAEREPDRFLSRHPPPVIVDEVQHAPSLFRHVKTTGSQKLTLMKSVSESLAGRADVLELETLSWAEAHAAVPRSYVATYLERDLRQSLRVTSLRDFERFIRACALRTGQMLNRAALARDVGISGSTAAAWLSVLEASGQVALLEPWFSNRTKSLVKSPKLYVCDSGLCAFLAGIRSPEDLLDSPQAGALWETLVFGELRRLQIDHRGGWELRFWRDRAKEGDSSWWRRNGPNCRRIEIRRLSGG